MKQALSLTPQEQLIFVDELDKHIHEAEIALVALEQGNNPAQSLEILFRNFHTIKGNANMAQFTTLGTFAHEIENVLAIFRGKEANIPPDLADLLFKAIDMTKNIKQLVQNQKTTIDSSLMDQIKKEAQAFLAKPQATSIASDSLIHHEIPPVIDIYLSKKEPLPAVRLFQILQLLDKSDIDYISAPSLTDIEKEQIHLPLQLWFAADHLKTFAEKLLRSIQKIDGVIAVVIHYPLIEAPIVQQPKAIAEAVSIDTQNKLQEIQIHIRKLDGLINLLGEILIDRNKISQNIQKLEEKYSLDPHVIELLDLVNHMGKITYSLQTELLNIRTIPLSNIVEKYPRLVRELARQLGKKVKLEIAGQHVELDRLILRHLNDLIIHLIRNAVDHGIEAPDKRIRAGKSEFGLIRIEAQQKNNKAQFIISDDGGGIDLNQIRNPLVKKQILTEPEARKIPDPDVIRYIFHPGFSTKDDITDISGRGVGMDVVQNTILKLGGQVLVENEIGTGCTFRITLPLTLAIIHGLIVKANDRTFIIPVSYVEEVVRSAGSEVQFINNKPHITIREAIIPLIHLKSLLYGGHDNIQKQKKLFIVIVSYNDQPTGIIVDKLLGEEEIVIKNIDYGADQYYIIHSATIMGTGDVGLILDIASLIDFITLRREEPPQIILSEAIHENTHC